MAPDLAVISMGDCDRQEDWTAWNYGHPRQEILAMLENAVTGTRTTVHVRAGCGAKTFEDFTVDRAIYATGWDGDVVLEAGADGVFERVASVAAFIGAP